MFKPGQFVKYYFIGNQPGTDDGLGTKQGRYRLFLIDSIEGEYYRYKLNIQLPKLILTKWDYDGGYKHINDSGIFRDEECIIHERKIKLEKLENYEKL